MTLAEAGRKYSVPMNTLNGISPGGLFGRRARRSTGTRISSAWVWWMPF